MAASVYKWLLIPVLYVVLSSGRPLPHPLHVSVIEINHNPADKTLEISCKIFTDDFEKVLAKNYNTKVDLINPPNKAAMDSLVKKYVLAHLAIRANDKPLRFSYLGFEHETEATYCYIEVANVPAVDKLSITTDLMYDLFDDQMNIMHVTIQGKRKSTKLDYPGKDALLQF